MSLRNKLAAIVVSIALASVAVIVMSTLATQQVRDRLAEIEQQQIPRLELGPQLDADFVALRRAYQDAVGAHDADALERTSELRDQLLARLDRGRDVLDPALSGLFRVALMEYHESAVSTSRRLMAAEVGESLGDAIASMQRHQGHARDLLIRLTAFDPQDYKRTLEAARDAQTGSARSQLASMLGSLVLVLGFSVWLSRSVVRSFGSLEEGFARFAKGTFDQPIVVGGDDEFAALADKANRMADSLARLASERERMDWVKTGLMELTAQLGGELDEQEVAARATRTVARYLDAPAAALYAIPREQRSKLVLLGHYGFSRGTSAGDAAPSFEMGEGLVGCAAQSSVVVVVEPIPADFVKVRSGLGEATPRILILVPLVHHGEVGGVLELVSFEPLSEAARELLADVSETIALTLAVAQNRASTRELLERTQTLATQLLQQEEELKSANEELRCQQEELQQTNGELGLHANQLAEQRLALQNKNDDLEEMGGRLRKQAAELTTVSAYKSQFLASMSHELRTPLNSMLLLSKLLSDNVDGNLTPKQLEYLKTVHSAGKDLLQLINQVLDLAKVESGKQEVEVETVRVQDVVERIRRVFAPVATEKGLPFIVDVASSVPDRITTDSQRLGQILTNLVGNAIKFTRSGEVRLVVDRPDPTLTFRNPDLDPTRAIAFSVSDTGVGIEREDQERVFSPFEQVRGSTRRTQGGTGLGLSISRELAQLLGGELHLRSKPGEGSTFVLFLPQDVSRPVAGAAGTPSRAPTDHESPSEDRPSDAHLLVIEDDPVFTGILEEIIQERGLSAHCARDGMTGLALARERRPRGIILDIKLPDIDGSRVMEELRSDPRTAAIPVHVISGVAMPERALLMGAAGYLRKPAEREDIVRVVEALGSGADRSARKVLVVEDDTTRDEVLVAQLAAEGLAARRATSTREALELLDHERFACMIIDLSVPDMRDLELLDELQRRRRADMPAIVVYTSRRLSRSEVTRLEAYAEAVVLKDGHASTQRLLDEIRLFIRRFEAGLPRRSLAARVPDVDIRLEGKTILVVDDDMRTAYALSASLRAKGAEVLVADTGVAALEVLAKSPAVDAVLMDVMMPEMDGYEATHAIRQQPAFKRLPIIALTAKAMKGDEARCLEAGATAYLPKPVDADALFALLHTHLVKVEGS
jgi:signal transduction histidine kinase/DNA-binding response OmpR family regulator